MQSNGVAVENGGGHGIEGVSKVKLTMSNGTHVDNGEVTKEIVKTSPVASKKQTRQLTKLETDIVRLMGQHLREMGYHQTLESLMTESGCPLEDPKASKLRMHVLSGDWEKANKTLNELGPMLEDPTNLEKMQFLLLEEKYLEQLENGQVLEALNTLRHKIAPLSLHHSDKHIHTLTGYMMYSNRDDLRHAAGWPGVDRGSRQILVDKLQGFLPATVMLPPHRLQYLMRQAQELQVERCPFHYLDCQSTETYSLLTDHICSKCQFPCETVHTLADHADEVWFLKFSHDGARLASGSKDGQIIIWNLSKDQPRKEHLLKAQAEGIAYLEWSPNDNLLLSCGKEGTTDIMVFLVETGEVKCHIQNSADDSLTCGAWTSDGHRFYVGGGRGQFYQCSVSGSVTGSWEGVRVQALATHPSTDLVYAADTHNRIRQYNFADKTSATLVQESHPIMSFVLSSDGRRALINLKSQSVNVWDIQDRVLLRRYPGVTQNQYTIHSTFGGSNDSFIASGSEDHHVYVWQTRREVPVAVLKGHSRTVNCVSWNPVQYELLASASDDGTVRIWSTEERLRAQLQYERLREKELASKREEEREALECSESEGMDTQHSETTSELERTEESTSSLSLSSDQLHDNIVTIAVESITQSAGHERLEPVRMRSGSHPERRPPRTDSGQWSTTSEPGDSASAAALSQLRSSSHGQDSSVDPDSSALSLDSSNGSTSQVSQSEYEESIQFSALPESELTRTSVRGDPASGGQEASSSSSSTRNPQHEEPEGGGSMSTVV